MSQIQRCLWKLTLYTDMSIALDTGVWSKGRLEQCVCVYSLISFVDCEELQKFEVLMRYNRKKSQELIIMHIQ